MNCLDLGQCTIMSKHLKTEIQTKKAVLPMSSLIHYFRSLLDFVSEGGREHQNFITKVIGTILAGRGEHSLNCFTVTTGRGYEKEASSNSCPK